MSRSLQLARARARSSSRTLTSSSRAATTRRRTTRSCGRSPTACRTSTSTCGRPSSRPSTRRASRATSTPQRHPASRSFTLPAYLGPRRRGGRHGRRAEPDALGAPPLGGGRCRPWRCCCSCAGVGDRLEPGLGIAAAVTLGGATLVLPFATLFFSHVLAATLGFAAFAVLLLEREGAPRTEARRARRPRRWSRGDRRVPARPRCRRALRLRVLATAPGCAERWRSGARPRRRAPCARVQPVGVRLAFRLSVRGLDGRAGREAAAGDLRVDGSGLRRRARAPVRTGGPRLARRGGRRRRSARPGRQARRRRAHRRAPGCVPALQRVVRSSRSAAHRPVPAISSPPFRSSLLGSHRRSVAFPARRSDWPSRPARSWPRRRITSPLAAWDGQVLHRLRTGGYVRSVLDFVNVGGGLADLPFLLALASCGDGRVRRRAAIPATRRRPGVRHCPRRAGRWSPRSRTGCWTIRRPGRTPPCSSSHRWSPG